MTHSAKQSVIAGRIVAVSAASPAADVEVEATMAARAAAVVDSLRQHSEALVGDQSVAPGEKAGAAVTAPPRPAPVLVTETQPEGLDTASMRLERRIRAHLTKGELSVTLTDNRYTMISVRRENKGTKRYFVRLHQMFAEATPAITRALARYIAYNDPEASRLLGDFIDANQHNVRSQTRRSVTRRMVTRGRFHDLQEIFDDLNRHYFGGTITARITWGARNGKPRRRNSIKMGSYSVEEQLIRIHRSLDRAFVPRFFVEWVVYHEMLHQVHDIKVVNGRRQFHSKAFLYDEAKFERYAEARLWERAHLDALLTY